MAKTPKNVTRKGGIFSRPTENQAAFLLGIGDRHFRRLVKAGLLPPKGDDGLYDGPAVITAWTEYVASDREASADMAESKRLFWQARARRERLEADELAAEVVKVDEVAALFREAMTTIAIDLDALPGRCAGELA